MERDKSSIVKSVELAWFQLTRSRGAWPRLHFENRPTKSFQLTRSRGAWRDWALNFRRVLAFQLTRSRGAWPAKSVIKMNQKDFNSHAHVERDNQILTINNYTKISTHTLTWSVTVWPLLSEYSKAISTHTLTWSVTQRWYGENCRGKFQLTRSRGAWPIGVNANFNMKHFNSHAHVERDRIFFMENMTNTNFNSHAHVERDGRRRRNYIH